MSIAGHLKQKNKGSFLWGIGTSLKKFILQKKSKRKFLGQLRNNHVLPQ